MRLGEIIRNQFNPLFFQGSLAAGGISLMAFNFLQFAVPHNKGLIKLSDIVWANLTGGQISLFAVLVAIMLVSVIIHVFLTTIFLGGLFFWLRDRNEFTNLIGDPYRNVTIFPIVGSLAMSANVFWAPVGFFVPWVSSGLQSLMLPSLVFFLILFVSLFFLEYKVLKAWARGPVDTDRLNFVWLLDVFAFALVALAGSGVAIISGNESIAIIAEAATVLTIIVGLLLLAVKTVYLVRIQIKLKKLPDTPVLPAFFLLIPIACLFGLSLYRLPSVFLTLLSIDITAISGFVLNLSYLAAITWLVFAIVILSNYLRKQFMRSKYAATQWGIV